MYSYRELSLDMVWNDPETYLQLRELKRLSFVLALAEVRYTLLVVFCIKFCNSARVGTLFLKSLILELSIRSR
jgi:hypothetical protein